MVTPWPHTHSPGHLVVEGAIGQTLPSMTLGAAQTCGVVQALPLAGLSPTSLFSWGKLPSLGVASVPPSFCPGGRGCGGSQQSRRVAEPVVICAFVSLSPADDVPPYFKTEPVRTQVHLEGNRLVLTCMAEGSWPLEFKWLHNSRELTRFSLEYRQDTPLPPTDSRLSCPEGH